MEAIERIGMWIAVCVMCTAMGAFYGFIMLAAILYAFRWPLVVIWAVLMITKVM